MTDIAGSARRASNSPVMDALARFGLVARAFVYMVIGWLAIGIARGNHTHQANQKGALAQIAEQTYGYALLWALGAGLTAYSLWRLSEAIFGTAADGRKAGPRIQSLVRAIIYAAFAVTTFLFIAGRAGQSQNRQQVTATARLMKHDLGRWLVGLIGLIVIIVGLGMIVEGALRKFEKQLRMHELQGTARVVVVALGVVGTISRGVVFAVAGGLVLDAAITYDASKSTGLDGALRTLADRAYGQWLLGALAVGLIVFGLYGFAAARWAKT